MVVVSTNFSPPGEGVLLEVPSTKLVLNDQEIGTATLYITEHNVVWGGGVRSAGGPSPTVNLLYPSISLHAVQRQPRPCIYMVLNHELRLPDSQPSGSSDTNANDDDDDDEFDADNQPITQVQFVPTSEGDLQAMYSALNQGQALHPDPMDEVCDDDYMDGEEHFEDGEDEFEDAEESEVGADDAEARMRQLRLERSNGTAPEHDEADISEE